MTTTNRPICVECRHYSGATEACYHDATREFDPVRGYKPVSAHFARGIAACGPAGKLFEPKMSMWQRAGQRWFGGKR